MFDWGDEEVRDRTWWEVFNLTEKRFFFAKCYDTGPEQRATFCVFTLHKDSNYTILGGEKIQIARFKVALWKCVVTSVPSGLPAHSGIQHFLPGRVSNIHTSQILSSKCHCPVHNFFIRIQKLLSNFSHPRQALQCLKCFPWVIFRTSPFWWFSWSSLGQRKGSGREKGKSSTMTSLTRCPTWPAQLDFTALLQQWIYDLCFLDLIP